MNMFKSILVAALMTASIAASAKTSIQIVGGNEASINEFPYIVSLQSRSGSHFCGGSLIAPNWILTAGHCVEGMTVGQVVIGMHDQKDTTNVEKMGVKRVIQHPKYNSRTMENDFALVQLSADSMHTPVAFNTTEIDVASEIVPAVVAGWGALKESSFSLPSKLQRVDVPLVPIDVCNVAYRGSVIESSMICAGYPDGGKDACQGDSGGPLVVTDMNTNTPVLVGVVSWGQGCARAKYYGIYSKVNAAAKWISDSMNKKSEEEVVH